MNKRNMKLLNKMINAVSVTDLAAVIDRGPLNPLLEKWRKTSKRSGTGKRKL